MKNFNKRTIWALGAVFVSVASFAGCSSNSASEAPPIDTSHDVPRRDSAEVTSRSK